LLYFVATRSGREIEKFSGNSGGEGKFKACFLINYNGEAKRKYADHRSNRDQEGRREQDKLRSEELYTTQEETFS